MTEMSSENVLLSVPFSLVGGVWLLYLLDYKLSVATAVGFIALAGLAADGASGQLETHRPTWTPVIFSTMATGKLPEEHGINTFVSDEGIPLTSNVRRAPALWNILSDHGLPSLFFSWPVTWPVIRPLRHRTSAAAGAARVRKRATRRTRHDVELTFLMMLPFLACDREERGEDTPRPWPNAPAASGLWLLAVHAVGAVVKAYVAKKGRQYIIDNVITRCPTQALSLNDDDTLAVDNSNCVRCMHCLNVMPKALHPGDDKGVTVLIGGKRTLKIGDLMGTVVVPFKKLETEEDYESLVEMAEEIIDFWAENGLEHERCGEMIERIGLVNFLEGIDVDVDPNMVNNPRQSSYVRMDGWDEEAEKWFARKAEA